MIHWLRMRLRRAATAALSLFAATSAAGGAIVRTIDQADARRRELELREELVAARERIVELEGRLRRVTNPTPFEQSVDDEERMRRETSRRIALGPPGPY